MPLVSVTIITLIVYPPSRPVLFPPAPVALVSSKTGGVQKPKAGVLGSHDSATGAPENHKGEAVEQEASNFVNGIASVALASATGKHPQDGGHEEEGAPGDSVPDPTSIAVGAADAKHKAAGGNPSQERDKTKVPMETAMWTKMRPVMHGIADVTDGWERFAKYVPSTFGVFCADYYTVPSLPQPHFHKTDIEYGSLLSWCRCSSPRFSSPPTCL
jgi:hypothetical protein